MPLYGGQRARAVRSSLFRYLNGCLTNLGYFSTTGNFTPVSFIDEIPQFESNRVIAPNTLAVIDGESETKDIEMGSYYGQHNWDYILEFYAENDAIGLQVSKDMQACLEGRYPGVSSGYPSITLYDYSLATPAPIGTLDVENIISTRMSGPQPWMRYWYAVRFTLIDYQLD